MIGDFMHLYNWKKNLDHMKYNEAKKYARQLRLNPTKPEQILWQQIRKRQLGGKKFLRQHPIFIKVLNGESFYFIPDFYCYEEKLAIELDGSIHEFTKESDSQKDTILSEMDIRVLRIDNSELKDIETVLEKIQNYFS